MIAAAERDALRTPQGIAEQAQRMLADPRAKQGIKEFTRQWLGLDKLATVEREAGNFNATLAAAMARETEDFVAHVLLEEDSVQTLFTADYTFVGDTLLTHYGPDATLAADPGAAGTRATLNTNKRMGLLTQASLLTLHAHQNETSPVHRGLFIRDRLMCQPPPPAPDDADIALPAATGEETTRERLLRHRADPACSSCHELMDPIGFAFEHYDETGRYRESQGDLPIDSKGNISASEDLDGEFDGALQLTQLLADSQQVRRCIATQYYRFAFGQDGDLNSNCSAELAKRALVDSGGNFRDMVLAFVQTDAFRYRSGKSRDEIPSS